MKKIVAVAAAALMLAGAAFADVSFSYLGTGIVTGSGKALDGIERNDCLSLTVSSDIAGVVADWDIHDNKAAEAKDVTKDVIELDSFYGWLTYGLPVGNLQITSGKWQGRYVNRVKSDAGDLDANYYEWFKPGVINSTIGNDSDNLTEGKMASVLAYTLADQLPGTLMVKLGAVNGVYGQFDSQAGFVGEVCWNQKGLLNANVAVKNYKKDQFVVSAFVSPLMLDKLNAMVGFTYATAKDVTSDFGVDARARWAFNDKVAVTGMFNFSQTKAEGADDATNSMWTMASVNYVAGDNIRFVATMNHAVADFAAEKGATITSFTPACEIKASEKVTVTAAFNCDWEGALYSGKGDVSLPIYVNVAL